MVYKQNSNTHNRRNTGSVYLHKTTQVTTWLVIEIGLKKRNHQEKADIYNLDLRLQLQILIRQTQILPHEMEPITSKEWLSLSFSIANPKPRTSERPQLLERLLCGRRQGRLDLGTCSGSENLLDLPRGEDFA